jgi:sugar phosphate isomerase/epimerase
MAESASGLGSRVEAVGGLAPEPRIAVASWSFHEEFEDPVVRPPFTPCTFMETCVRELEVNAVEFLYSHLVDPEEDPEHPSKQRIEAIKEAAKRLGVEVVCVAVDNDFVTPTESKRNEDIEYVARCVATAHDLGARLVRINAGISRCCAEVIPLLLDSVEAVREKCRWVDPSRPDSVMLVLENQGGITEDAYNIMDIMLRAEEKFGPGVLGVCLDTGNSVATDCVRAIKLLARPSNPCRPKDDPHQVTPSQVKQKYAANRIHVARMLTRGLFPDPKGLQLADVDRSILNKNYIAHVHAKSYAVDPETDTGSLDMQYTHVLWQLFLSRYAGYYSIEYEGQQGYSAFLQFEREEETPDVNDLSTVEPASLDAKNRLATTKKAIENLKLLIHNTYNDYYRDMWEAHL